MSCMQSQLLNIFPAAWTIASKDPSLVLCKFHFHGCGTTINVNRTVIYCVSIDQKLNWSLSLQNRTIHFGVCSMLGLLPTLVNSCAKLKSVLDVLDVAYVCSGNSDHQFLQQWQYNASTLHGCMCVRDVCVRDVCVRDVCVRDVCVRDVCVRDVCVRDVCVRDVCVRDVCEGCVCEGCVCEGCVCEGCVCEVCV